MRKLTRRFFYAFMLFFNYFRLKFFCSKNKSFSRLKDLKNSLKGEDLYILASGPSLSKIDLSKLKDKNVVTLHYSYLAINHVDVKSHYWVVAAESRMIDFGDVSRKQFNASFWGPGSIVRRKYPFKFFSKNDVIIPPVFFFENFVPKQYRGFLDRQVDGAVNKKLSREAPVGMSVIFLGIQVAYFLGAKNIFLLGADFGSNNGSFYFNDRVKVVDEKMLQGKDPYEDRYNKHIKPALEWYNDFLNKRNVGLYNASYFTRDDITKRVKF